MTTYLSEYAHFKTKEEMDKASTEHVAANINHLNQTDLAVLNMIRRYSVKHGAAHLKHKTMEKALGKSNSTIRRSLRKLESLLIVQRIKFIRKVLSGLGANIYVILPLDSTSEQSKMNSREEATNSDLSKPEQTKSENEPLFYKSFSYLVPNTYSNSSNNKLADFYSVFKQFIEARLGECSQALISKLYGVFRAISIKQLKFNIHAEKKDQFEALALQSIAITLQATKKKPIKSITGFYSGVYSNLVSKYIIGFEHNYSESQFTAEHDIEWFIPTHLLQPYEAHKK